MKPVYPAVFCWLCIGLTGASVIAQGRDQGRRRAFDPASFLQRMDANGDGALQTSEMSGRTQQFIEGLGFDTTQTIPLDKVLAKINGDKAESEKVKQQPAGSSNSSASAESTRKVPSFRSERTKGILPAFAGGGTGPSEKSLEGKYGAPLMEQVDGALRRYDTNSDGVIDSTEIGEGRWGQPDPKESDLNGDGRLSKAELAERYYRRERAANNNSDSSGSNASSDNGGRSTERDQSRGGRDSERRRAEESSSESSKSDSDSRSSESSSQSSTSSSGDKFRKYADGLIAEYDANKDGKLDKDEIAKMKQKPENADLDKDGFVSPGELTEALASGNMGSGGSSSSSPAAKPEARGGAFRNRSVPGSKGPNDSGNSDNGGDSSKTSERTTSQFSFNAADKNRDGQVQMHEFTDQWNEEKLNEFRQLDANGDGVITNAENRNKK